MAAITDVTLTSGAPTAGTGTVSTLDKFNGTAGSSTTQALTVQGIASGTPVPSKITDGTNAATIKAASTAPLSTDPALVVAISPNSVNANGQATNANSAPVVLSSQQTFSGQNAALPVNQIVVGGQFNTTPTTLTTTNVSPLQIDNAGNLLVNIKAGASSGVVTQGSTTSGQSGSLIQGAVTTSAPSYTTAQTSPLSLDTAGNLRVNVVTGGGSTTTQTPVAPAAATATNATLIGGQYNSTDVAFTNGQQGQVSIDQRGGLYVQDGQAIAPVSVTSATTLFTIANTSGYEGLSLQVTSAGTTCTITYEASEDGTTWTSVPGNLANNAGASVGVSTSTAVGLYFFQLTAKQFRARVSTYTSGTVTVQATLRKSVVPRLGVAATVVNTTLTNLQASNVGGYTYNHISTSTTTTVKSGVGTLHTISINSLGTVASTVTIFDSTTGSGTVIGVLNSLTTGQGTYTFDLAFLTGLTIVTTGTVAPDVTVTFK